MATSSRSSAQVKVDSVRAAFPEPDELISEVFFDAQQYPTITFVSTTMETDDDRLWVTGDLTMKGTTRPVRAEGRRRRNGLGQQIRPAPRTTTSAWSST